MGLFDLFRPTAGSSERESENSVQEASRLIDEGNAIEDAGRLEEAMQRYEAAIRQSPNLARAHLNRGNALLAMDKADEALKAFATALSHNPDYAAAHFNMGNTHARLRHHKAALESYREAIRLKPDFVDAQVALGGILEDLGRDDEAMAHYQTALTLNPQHAGAANNLERLLLKVGQLMLRAERYAELENLAHLVLGLNPDSGFAWNILGTSLQLQGKDGLPALRKTVALLPDDAEAHVNLGIALQSLGQLDEAVASCRRALQIKPDYAEAHFNLGNAQKDLGQFDEAVTSYHRALQIKSDYAEAHNNLGIALQDLGQFDEAVASCRRALLIKPDYAEAHNNLGIALQELGQLDEAAACCRRALEFKPDYAEAHVNLGNVLKDLGQLDEAMASYHRALRIKPDFAEAHSNFGNALKDQGQLDDAIAAYGRALVIKPDYAEAHTNLGIALLETGQYSEGWQEYEYRWEGCTPKRSRPASPLPQWTGQRVSPSDRLLIFMEQGLGDMLQFGRYLPLAAAHFPGGVSVHAIGPMRKLFRRSFPMIDALDAIPTDQRAWQWQCPLLSLPLAFGTTLETIPHQGPYLTPDPVRVIHWQSRIAALGLPASTRKIGVVWKSGTAMKIAQLKSITLQALAPLLNQPDCVWFSLQKEPDPDKGSWVASGKLIDWTDEFGDFNETASLAMNLDMIISVDTSVAHLAGGLGLPTWLLNRHASDWRWMRNREDSPWYPTMHIFTQNTAGNWDEVVSRMSSVLAGELSPT